MSRASVVIGSLRRGRGAAEARVRRPRRTKRAIALRVTAGVLLVGLLVWGGYWLLESPTFAVARVETGPYRFSEQGEVETALRSALGQNIWRLSVREVESAFAGLPWVQSVRMVRRVPDVVRVELQEWRPLLAVDPGADARTPHVLLGDGRVLEFPAHLDAPGLPMLVGSTLERSGESWRLDDRTTVLVLDLLDALAETGLEASCPVDFIRATPLGLVVVLQRRAGSLLVGDEDLAGRLERYLLARERIPAGAAVDLRFEDRVTFEPPAASVAEG